VKDNGDNILIFDELAEQSACTGCAVSRRDESPSQRDKESDHGVPLSLSTLCAVSRRDESPSQRDKESDHGVPLSLPTLPEVERRRGQEHGIETPRTREVGYLSLAWQRLTVMVNAGLLEGQQSGDKKAVSLGKSKYRWFASQEDVPTGRLDTHASDVWR